MKIFICFIATIFTISGFSQVKETSEKWIDTTIHKSLTKLDTDYPFKVLVSNDSLKTTSETTKILNNAKSYFDEIFNMDLDFAVLFIENENWNEYAYFPPPGIPQAWKGNVILGLDKSSISKQVENGISTLPEEHLLPLKKVYGENINLDLFYREALSIHELAHLYHLYHGTRPQRKWLQELFANMSMYSFAKKNCGTCYDQMNTFPMFSKQLGDDIAEFKSLEDFEEKYVNNLHPRNYEWFQFQFYYKAKDIINKNGENILVSLKNFLAETDLSKTERMSDEELAIRLETEVGKDISGILTNWNYQLILFKYS